MKKLSLEETVRGLLSEQNDAKKQWEKEKKPEIDIGGHAHDPSGPNKAHIEEEDQIDEITGTATSLGGRHNPQRSPSKWLAGSSLKKRSGLMRTGNQRRRTSTYTEEAVGDKFKKKLSQKNNEKVLGKTATGQQGETIDTEPNKPEFTGFQ